ncbi:MAG: hypothetical protein HY928_05325 [Elusimicrobia bacterium]|nr:hypothetical protein [Elusimicrobiota bacterium]
MEIAKSLMICMLGLSLWGRAAHLARKPAPAPKPAATQLKPALAPVPLQGAFRAVIDGRVLPSPVPPAGEPTTLTVQGRLIRAVPLDIKDRYAPYYLAEDGRMLETQWRWESGAMKPSVRYRRGMLELPSPT